MDKTLPSCSPFLLQYDLAPLRSYHQGDKNVCLWVPSAVKFSTAIVSKSITDMSVMDMIFRKWEPVRRNDCKGCSISLDFSELWVLSLVGNSVCLHWTLVKTACGLEWSLGEVWGSEAWRKQPSLEWCSWPLPRRKHIFHTVTLTQYDFQSSVIL